MVARRRGRIATLEVCGTIGGAVRTSVYVPLVEAVRRSRRLRGLVLDIDSPGGTAAASAEMHGGRIGVESTVWEGTTFTLTPPLIPAMGEDLPPATRWTY